MSAGSLRPWLLGVRPKTLTATIAPILVASALAKLQAPEKFCWELSLFAFLSTLFIQIGTNLFNDALDFKKGADTSERIGPMRVTQSGLLSPQAVTWGGAIAFVIATALGVPLLMAGGWPIVAIGALSLLCGYAYTGGPFPLAYVGLGDLFVLIFFGWVAVLGLVYLQTGQMTSEAWLAGTQTGLLATSLIAINNLRDHVGDKKAGKKTLAARFGPTFAKLEVTALLITPILLGLAWYFKGHRLAFYLPLILLPAPLALAHQVFWNEPGPKCNSYLARASLIHLAFSLLLSLGLWLSAS